TTRTPTTTSCNIADAKSIALTLGGGNDKVSMDLSDAGISTSSPFASNGITVNTAGGNDAVSMNLGRIGDNATGKATVDLGAGDDTLFLRNGSVGSKASLTLNVTGGVDHAQGFLP